MEVGVGGWVGGWVEVEDGCERTKAGGQGWNMKVG